MNSTKRPEPTICCVGFRANATRAETGTGNPPKQLKIIILSTLEGCLNNYTIYFPASQPSLIILPCHIGLYLSFWYQTAWLLTRLTLLLQLQVYALSAVHVGDAAVDVDGSAVVQPLAFLPQLDHPRRGVSVRVRVEVVPAVRLVDGDVQVGQVELDGGLGVPGGHAHTLDALPHHGALGLLEEDRGVCRGYTTLVKHTGTLTTVLPLEFLSKIM